MGAASPLSICVGQSVLLLMPSEFARGVKAVIEHRSPIEVNIDVLGPLLYLAVAVM